MFLHVEQFRSFCENNQREKYEKSILNIYIYIYIYIYMYIYI